VSFRQELLSIFSKRHDAELAASIQPSRVALGHVPPFGLHGHRGMQASGTPVGGARPGWLRAIALQCLALLVTLAACEVILRVVDLRYLRMDESGIAPVYGHDSALGWYPIPIRRRPTAAPAPCMCATTASGCAISNRGDAKADHRVRRRLFRLGL